MAECRITCPSCHVALRMAAPLSSGKVWDWVLTVDTPIDGSSAPAKVTTTMKIKGKMGIDTEAGKLTADMSSETKGTEETEER